MAHRYGVHGDYLKDGKLDLPELLEVPSADDWEWVRDFIQRRRWQQAVTYRETAPHEYTVRETSSPKVTSRRFKTHRWLR